MGHNEVSSLERVRGDIISTLTGLSIWFSSTVFSSCTSVGYPHLISIVSSIGRAMLYGGTIELGPESI